MAAVDVTQVMQPERRDLRRIQVRPEDLPADLWQADDAVERPRKLPVIGEAGAMSELRRRQLFALLGGAAALPVAARAERSATPVIGFLHPAARDTLESQLSGFRQGLKETGFVDGENVAIVYHRADDQMHRLDLRSFAVIATVQTAASALKAATPTIPIVFVAAGDPVQLGLVASLARPDGNLTGTNFFGAEAAAKRLELLRQLAPKACGLRRSSPGAPSMSRN